MKHPSLLGCLVLSAFALGRLPASAGPPDQISVLLVLDDHRDLAMVEAAVNQEWRAITAFCPANAILSDDRFIIVAANVANAPKAVTASAGLTLAADWQFTTGPPS